MIAYGLGILVQMIGKFRSYIYGGVELPVTCTYHELKRASCAIVFRRCTPRKQGEMEEGTCQSVTRYCMNDSLTSPYGIVSTTGQMARRGRE